MRLAGGVDPAAWQKGARETEVGQVIVIKNLHGASEIQGAADLIAFAKSCQRTALIRRATSACSSVSLSNVLKKAGIGNKPHLAISCHDDCEENREKFKYGVSIPMAKARDPDTILAWDMNGETLTAERGFPLRLVVPGFAGASVIKEKADWSKAPVINEMPLNSAVLSPLESATVPAGKLTVQGFAICTQSLVARVEVSGDGGKSWVRGELLKEGDSKWSWVHWRAELGLKPGGRQIVVRAFDSQGRGQPASAAPIYNFPGYLMTAWHSFNVQVKGAA